MRVMMVILILAVVVETHKSNFYGRRLLGNIDVSKSEISGSGVTSPVVGQSNNVLLKAKDYFGNDVGVGGESIFIMVQNQCTRGINMSCIPVSEAMTVVANTIVSQMIDNGDGTYSYSYTVSIPGNITVSVIVAVRVGVAGEYFDNTSLTPPSVQNLTTDLFYYKWGTCNISSDKADRVSVHFITYVTPFITDTYNFTLVSDAGNKWTFDGYVTNNNMNPVGNKTYYYNNVALNAFQTYNVIVDYADWGGNSEIQMYWKTSTVANQTIPKENLSIPYDAASSPYQITVNCPTGYKVGGAVMNQCVTNCGDGLVYGAEVCDDANSVSGDGCTSDCTKIEDEWICLNGSTSHKSDCSKCDSGYEPNSAKTKCDVSSTSNEVTALIIFTLLTTVINASFSLISSIKNQSSIQSTFSGLNQLQLILLLPLIGAFVPAKVVQFIAGLNISYNLFGSIDISSLIPDFIKNFSYDQSNSYLSLINLGDGSSFFNSFDFFYPLLITAVQHCVLAILNLCCRKANQNKLIPKVILKLYEGMTFATYIRITIECYLLLLIASLSELYSFRFNKTDHRASKIFAALLFSLCNLITIFVVIQTFIVKVKADQDVIQKRRQCIQWFSGLKENKISRLYTVLFFIRRQLFCVLILLFQDLSMILKVSVYASIQFVYFVVLCFLRPFEKTKDMITDCINEMIYFVLCILLTYFNTENTWSSVVQNIYIWIIISNNLVLFAFEFLSYFKCKKRSRVYQSEMRVTPARGLISKTSRNNNIKKKALEKDESNINDQSDIRIDKAYNEIASKASKDCNFIFYHQQAYNSSLNFENEQKYDKSPITSKRHRREDRNFDFNDF